ncbi:MAG TPA: hypothetical protein VF744_03180 [Beijerinckiaceae bacterium]|jgi:hypothetical protein
MACRPGETGEGDSPVPNRLSTRTRLAAAALGLAALGLAGCIWMPAAVEGLPAGGSWVALPLRAWIAEGGVRAEGIAGCFSGECAPRVAVGIFRATGAEARTLQAVLREPERLVRFIAERDAADTDPRRRGVRTVATVEKLREGAASGFLAALMREDGSRAAHAAVLGRETAEGLRLALIVGESPEGVRMTAREVAAKLK